MKYLFLLAALFACAFATTFDDLAVKTNGLNDFTSCRALTGLTGTPNKVAAVLFWTINANDVSFGMSALSDGWVGVGFSRQQVSTPARMFNNDLIVGFRNPDNGFLPDVDDYFVDTTQVLCDTSTRGVCRDSDRNTFLGTAGCKQDLTSTSFVFDNATKVSHMRFTKPMNSGDNNCDTPILNQPSQFIFAFNSLSAADRMDYHGSGRDSFTANLFDPTPACPSGPGGVCNGIGQCVKGCCICPDDLGVDCSVKAGGGNAALKTDINKQNYPFSLQLDDNFALNWNIDQVEGTIDFAIQCKCTGWVAFGPGEPVAGGMIGTDAILAWINADGTLTISDNMINDRASSAIVADIAAGGTDDLLGSFGKLEGGVTTVIWRRKLVTGDKLDRDFVTGPMWASYAYNPTTPGPNLVQHLGTTRNPVKIDFFAGTGAVSDTDALRKAHGAMMFVVWSVAIPFTSFIARFLKAQLGKAWFEIHRITNGVAMLVQLAAFIIAVIFSTNNHFNTPHKIIGLIVFILGTVQPILGTIADRLFDPNRDGAPIFPDKVHWIVGWLSLGLGLANIVLGLQSYGALIEIFYASIALSCFIGVFLIVFTVQNLITHWPPPPDH